MNGVTNHIYINIMVKISGVTFCNLLYSLYIMAMVMVICNLLYSLYIMAMVMWIAACQT